MWCFQSWNNKVFTCYRCGSLHQIVFTIFLVCGRGWLHLFRMWRPLNLTSWRRTHLKSLMLTSHPDWNQLQLLSGIAHYIWNYIPLCKSKQSCNHFLQNGNRAEGSIHMDYLSWILGKSCIEIRTSFVGISCVCLEPSSVTYILQSRTSHICSCVRLTCALLPSRYTRMSRDGMLKISGLWSFESCGMYCHVVK